jgi:predicted ABC-type ATPase
MSGAMETSPAVVILAGPNRAGKSTSAPYLLEGALEVTEFVNADVIARDLSGFNPEGAALSAGKSMLRRLRELAAQRTNFAFESTLASKTLAPWIAELRKMGYAFHLVYLWVPSAEFCISRVKERVSQGGHHVPSDVIQRRYRGGLENFFHLYMPLTESWRLYDNREGDRRLIAKGRGSIADVVEDPEIWQRLTKEHDHA